MDPSDLEGLSPEDLEQLVALGVIPDQMSALDRQYKQAAQLRNTPMAQTGGNGRVVTAASPLEHLAVGVDRYRGQKDIQGIEKRQGELMGQQVQGRNKYLEALLGRRGMPKPGVIQGPMEPNFGVPDPTKIKPMGF